MNIRNCWAIAFSNSGLEAPEISSSVTQLTSMQRIIPETRQLSGI